MGDNITRPDHYCEGREYEPKDVIRDWGLNFNLGSAVKYISRAGRKGDKLEDLQKAKQFLEFEIAAVEKGTIASYATFSDEYVNSNIDAFVRAVLNGELDIDNNFESDEIREKIIDRIIEKWKRDEISLIDIPDDVWCYSKKIRDYGSYLCDECVKEARKDVKKKLEERLIEEKEKRISAELLSRAVTRSENPMKFEDMPESLKSRVINNIAQEVLDSQIIPPDEIREAVIDRIVEWIENDELDCFDISYNLYNAYQDIRDAIARQALHKVGEAEREDLKRFVQKIDRGEIDCNVIPSELYSSYKDIRDAVERRTSWYTNGILGHWYYYQNIPDGYKTRVIDRIVEMVRNGELDLMDIPNDLYDECVRSRADIANSDYRKAPDGIKKYAEDTEDTVSIKFEFEVDPDIDTDTVNVHVYIKNKED